MRILKLIIIFFLIFTASGCGDSQKYRNAYSCQYDSELTFAGNVKGIRFFGSNSEDNPKLGKVIGAVYITIPEGETARLQLFQDGRGH